ncbi:MAG: hypothetical protein NTZ97_03360 [Candidatus Moranbacteria bacterium]|nr:hypothetical protein [Candidatus Moranbacteria bacterium]
MTTKEKVIAVIILILVGISYRLFPHPPNFAPVAAISLFSGFYFRRYFIFIPVVIMLVSDIFIGFYDWKLMAVVYFSFILVCFIGILMRKNKSVLSLIGYSLTGSILFFLLTNFAVWFFASWYPHNFQGLTECYLMAIPFFKNTIAGDLFYASVIFGCYEILAQPKEKLAFLWNRPKTI